MQRRHFTKIASALAFCPLTIRAAKVTELNIGHVASADGHHYQVYAERLAQRVAEETNGEIKINIFPAGQLGGEVKMIQSVRSGSLAFVITAEPPLENTVREFGIFSLPYLFNDMVSANRALQGQFGRQMFSYLPKYGLTGVAWISPQERNIFGNKQVLVPDDMRGIKIRVIQSPGYVQAYEALGAQATPMAYNELYMALQTGVIDAGETSPDLMIKDKFAEVSKYFTIIGIHYMPCVVLGSERILNKLPTTHRETVLRLASELAQVSIDAYGQTYTESLSEMKRRGLDVRDGDRSAFLEATRPIYPVMLPTIPDSAANVELARQSNK